MEDYSERLQRDSPDAGAAEQTLEIFPDPDKRWSPDYPRCINGEMFKGTIQESAYLPSRTCGPGLQKVSLQAPIFYIHHVDIFQNAIKFGRNVSGFHCFVAIVKVDLVLDIFFFSW